jgi:diacylglycerol kinase family enzyme
VAESVDPAGTALESVIREPAITILVNPGASVVNGQTVQELTEGARAVGLDAQVIGTQSQEEMIAIIRRHLTEHAPRLAVAGGDGTVACAAKEFARTGTALGIIPLGYANNVATALRLPRDLPSALRVLRDGVEPFRERTIMCTVANTRRMALADPVAPEAGVGDGLLDVIVIGNLSRWEVLRYYRAIRAAAHLGLPKVKSLRGREVRIEGRRPMNVHCDDRIVGKTPAMIAVEPGALRVLVEGR